MRTLILMVCFKEARHRKIPNNFIHLCHGFHHSDEWFGKHHLPQPKHGCDVQNKV